MQKSSSLCENLHNRKKYAKIPSRTEKPPCTAHKIRRGEIRNREAIKRRRKGK